MQGTIWTMETRYRDQLERGSITVKDKHYSVTKLDSTLAEIFSSASATFKTNAFPNDPNSIFRDAKTLRKALQTALKETFSLLVNDFQSNWTKIDTFGTIY